mmetsp:Transcript_79396/g.184238  ORF Transcript_79396/g.184238 Transcript_79396/m.184238 type:complete len:335 (-) Transcript_79396:97-1101(-)
MTPGGKLNVADLVTQAPNEDDIGPSKKPNLAAIVKAASPPPDDEPPVRGCPCRCLFPRRRPEPKLASVVPVVQEEVWKTQGRANFTAPTPRPEEEPTPDPDCADAATPPGEEEQERVEEQKQATADATSLGCTGTEQRGKGFHIAEEQHGQLGPQLGPNIGRKTLVLDLDETLVHSSFRLVHAADIVITVELEGEHHRVFVRKRPGVDQFLAQVAQLYEVVVYTASMSKYANQLLDQLDKERVVSFRLFREACTRMPNGYVKDLSKLGRNLKDVIIIDNSPTCYTLQPHNAIPIKTWRDDPNDRELLDLVPILYSLSEVEDITMVLQQIVWTED